MGSGVQEMVPYQGERSAYSQLPQLVKTLVCVVCIGTKFISFGEHL